MKRRNKMIGLHGHEKKIALLTLTLLMVWPVIQGKRRHLRRATAAIALTVPDLILSGMDDIAAAHGTARAVSGGEARYRGAARP